MILHASIKKALLLVSTIKITLQILRPLGVGYPFRPFQNVASSNLDLAFVGHTLTLPS